MTRRRRSPAARTTRADVLRGVRRMGFRRPRDLYLLRLDLARGTHATAPVFRYAQAKDKVRGWQLWDVFYPPARAPADAVWIAVSPSGVVAIAVGGVGPGGARVIPLPHSWSLNAGMGRTFATMGRLKP